MVPLEEVHKLLDQAISAWSNRQYEEISHGTTNGPPGQIMRIFLPIIDVLIDLQVRKIYVLVYSKRDLMEHGPHFQS